MGLREHSSNRFSCLTILYLQDKTAGNQILTGWHVSVPGILSVTAYDNQNFTAQFGKYYFRVRPLYVVKESVSMHQNISFENFILLISAGIARYNASVNFQCSGNQYGYFQLIFIDLNGLAYHTIHRSKLR